MTTLAVIAAWGVVALDLFDRLYDRYAVRFGEWECGPDSWFAYGYIEGERRTRRFFHLKLPSYDWQQDIASLKWCWHQRVLWWADDRGLNVGLWPVRN